MATGLLKRLPLNNPLVANKTEKASPDCSDISTFGRLLADHGYTETKLVEKFGHSGSPVLQADVSQLARTRKLTARNVLLRLFYLGQSVRPTELAQVFTAAQTHQLKRWLNPKLEIGDLHPAVSLAVVDGLLVASDPAWKRFHPDFVPGISPTTLALQQLSVPTSGRSLLDLGSGQGFLALRGIVNGARVTASDINPRAHQLLGLSLELNGLANIECLTGTYFEPLAGRTFDTIVANPNFVIGAPALTHYSTGRADDSLALDLALQAVPHLNEGGTLQMMCDWLEFPDRDLNSRLTTLFAQNNCDVWVLPTSSVSPERYVEIRLKELRMFQRVGDSSALSQRWLGGLQQRHVARVSGGMLMVRKRCAKNWIHVETVTEIDSGYAGSLVQARCQHFDRYFELSDDQLCLTRPQPVAGLEMTQRAFEGETGLELSADLKINQGLIKRATVDSATLMLLRNLDGQTTLLQAIDRLSANGVSSDSLRADALSAVRQLLVSGFLRL